MQIAVHRSVDFVVEAWFSLFHINVVELLILVGSVHREESPSQGNRKKEQWQQKAECELLNQNVR